MPDYYGRGLRGLGLVAIWRSGRDFGLGLWRRHVGWCRRLWRWRGGAHDSADPGMTFLRHLPEIVSFVSFSAIAAALFFFLFMLFSFN